MRGLEGMRCCCGLSAVVCTVDQLAHAWLPRWAKDHGPARWICDWHDRIIFGGAS